VISVGVLTLLPVVWLADPGDAVPTLVVPSIQGSARALGGYRTAEESH
jgi:hypothetical protein